MQLVAMQQETTMSSREIADLLQMRHDVVKRSIERLFSKTDDQGKPAPVIIEPPLVDEQFLDAMNRPRSESVYKIGKRDSYVVVAQLSPEFTGRLVDRWQELENNPVQPIMDLSNPEWLRSALLNYSEQVITLSQEVKTLNQAIDTITSGASDIKFQQASKVLGITQSVLASWLREHRWDRYLNKSRASTAYSEERGYCWTKYEQKTGVKPSGAEYEFTQIEFFIKPKGMAILTKEFQ